MKKLLSSVPLLALFCLGVGKAQAISYAVSLPLATTNWEQTIDLPQFDPAICPYGTPIAFSMGGQVEGTIKFENTDAEFATITAKLAAELLAEDPTNPGTYFLTVQPSVDSTETVSAFDGTIDFGGSSGRTYTNLMGSDYAAIILTSGALYDRFFVGISVPQNLIDIHVHALSSGAGAGNLILQFITLAGVDVEETCVPEPKTLLLLGIGLAGLAGYAYRRRRNSWA